MKYKGYEANIEYDDEAKILHGEVFGIKDVVTFQATCVEDLEKEFHRSLDEYLVFCKEMGKKPDRPYSGKIPLRTTPDLHARIALMAKKEDTSINKWINKELEHVLK
jgi:predicted HicB family RNase H-like nuclease